MNGPNGMPPMPPSGGGAMPTMGTKCRECGTIHPAVQPGQSCPIASAKSTEVGGARIEVDKLVETIKTVMTSQIAVKGIKDMDKLQKYLIIETTKSMEKYPGD